MLSCRKLLLILVLLTTAACGPNPAQESASENNFVGESDGPADESTKDLWVMGYYPGWMQGPSNNGKLPAEAIDYSAITHLAHFALMPTKEGGLEGNSNTVTPAGSKAAVAAAKKAGVKILISIGGWASEEGFRAATSPANLDKFVGNIVGYMQKYGYDGVDLDWEILRAKDKNQFIKLTKKLRSELNKISPRPLLTAATQWEYDILAALAADLDQINLMTYDFSGPWPGTKVWHHSALYSSGNNKSVNSDIDKCLKLGIPAKKLGLGIGLYGYAWTGVTAPGQGWQVAPKTKTMTYNVIMEKHYAPQYIKWDDSASAPYLSIDKPGTADDMFITFDNATSAKAKVNYVRQKGIGGAIIWALGGDQMADGSYPLMKAVKEAAFGPGQ